ncbi:hypothetical protein GCM10011519_34130 [Marmoricola endophyticus]|uniref:Uncharacterized protein n=1 Tax=Marmoricola endophyticus TaxID=2040280 RepID=A0A917F9C0_9ACTN|nr:hypothetical protein [Marmoricola endophyticus]GGF57343.1 hypothetical protein GCM10011519_34130 [Marmoricola endophyticus]
MIPDHLLRLVDDAATFPPVSMPLDQAVAQHREHRAADHGGLVGRLALTDARISEVAPYLDPEDPTDVLLVVTGGAGALEPATTRAARTPGLRLAAVALRLRDEADLAHNAGRAVAMVDHLRSTGGLAEDTEVLLEPPRLAHSPEHGWLAALDEVAMADLSLRFRTGGADPEDRPSPEELARCLDAALDRETPYACTGGLGAVSDPDRYGLLNLLVATRVALDGGDVAAALTSPSPLVGTDPEALARARRWFTSATSTDLLEVHEDLVEAGVL